MIIDLGDLRIEVALKHQQFRLLMLKMNELSESNVLVAATNLATDHNITLEQAIPMAIQAMNRIRETKRDLRENIEPEDVKVPA